MWYKKKSESLRIRFCRCFKQSMLGQHIVYLFCMSCSDCDVWWRDGDQDRLLHGMKCKPVYFLNRPRLYGTRRIRSRPNICTIPPSVFTGVVKNYTSFFQFSNLHGSSSSMQIRELKKRGLVFDLQGHIDIVPKNWNWLNEIYHREIPKWCPILEWVLRRISIQLFSIL